MEGLGKGIGDTMVCFVCLCALAVPLAIGSVVSLAFLLLGLTTAALIAVSAGLAIGLVFLCLFALDDKEELQADVIQYLVGGRR